MAPPISASWHKEDNMSVLEEKGPAGMKDWTAEDFDGLVGKTLDFERPAGSNAPAPEPASMTLLEVKRSPKSVGAPRDSFSLLLKMKDQAPLSLGLHRLAQEGFAP